MARGHIHPISSLMREANEFFYKAGFEIEDGPLVESQWFNFDALNVPRDHPARDMQDTFHMQGEDEMVLRTHMTGAHAHYVKAQLEKGIMPPYRGIAMGPVFRNEATDATHESEFWQLDGFVIDAQASLAQMRGLLSAFYSAIMHGEAEIRFRPSFFPFTEPSVEIDMRVSGERVPERLRGRWIEMMGAGMFHPNVIAQYGLDPAVYRGFAFGGGLDRIALLRWGIEDVRLMHSADLRFVNQF